MLVAFAWFLIAAGVLGLINPQWIRMASRKQAVVALILGVIIGAFAMPAPPPAVPAAAITHAHNIITGYTGVRDSHVEIEGDRIVLAITVGAATNEDYARQLGDNFARALSSGASMHAAESFADGPRGRDYLGSLYEHYNMQVIVAWSPDHVIAQGAKARTANQIRW